MVAPVPLSRAPTITLQRPDHRAAADDDIAQIRYDGLAGRDGVLRLVERDPNAPRVPVVRKAETARAAGVVVAYARAGGDALRARFLKQLGHDVRREAPDPIVGQQAVCAQILALAQRDGVCRRIRCGYVHRVQACHAQALSLADGVSDRPRMASQHVAVRIQHVAGCQWLAVEALDIPGKIVVGHKADALAVSLFRIAEALFARDAAHILFLDEPAERQHRVGQALLREGVQDVALVFTCVDAAGERVYKARVFRSVKNGLQGRIVGLRGGAQQLAKGPHACVVTGRHRIASKLECVVEQRAELEMTVAVDAGVGRTPLFVRAHEFVDDGF